jgi:hypothetical protein
MWPSTVVIPREGSFTLASLGRIKNVHDVPFGGAAGRKSLALKQMLGVVFTSLSLQRWEEVSGPRQQWRGPVHSGLLRIPPNPIHQVPERRRLVLKKPYSTATRAIIMTLRGPRFTLSRDREGSGRPQSGRLPQARVQPAGTLRNTEGSLSRMPYASFGVRAASKASGSSAQILNSTRGHASRGSGCDGQSRELCPPNSR